MAAMRSCVGEGECQSATGLAAPGRYGQTVEAGTVYLGASRPEAMAVDLTTHAVDVPRAAPASHLLDVLTPKCRPEGCERPPAATDGSLARVEMMLGVKPVGIDEGREQHPQQQLSSKRVLIDLAAKCACHW